MFGRRITALVAIFMTCVAELSTEFKSGFKSGIEQRDDPNKFAELQCPTPSSNNGYFK